MESECFSIISARFARGSDLFLIFSQQHEHWKPISEPRTRSANLRNLFVENICFNLLSAQSSSVASFMTEWASLSLGNMIFILIASRVMAVSKVISSNEKHMLPAV